MVDNKSAVEASAVEAVAEGDVAVDPRSILNNSARRSAIKRQAKKESQVARSARGWVHPNLRAPKEHPAAFNLVRDMASLMPKGK